MLKCVRLVLLCSHLFQAVRIEESARKLDEDAAGLRVRLQQLEASLK